ncbi:fibroblast growth factor receptor-like 1 [Hyalella azteca]|uniref:receptor protein-tyrosine kinase n=1 Tax=Hyalella azteca TaxID=294128 RepID=A0A8B7NTS5_HYAAZ|nr:fibroblast growth factor receptor-like 1 [Hyalella azteca]
MAPPRVELVSPYVLLTVGQKHRLTCPIRGSPSPIYEWFKDGEDIAYWHRYVDRGNHLKLKEVDLQDEGTYTCKAVNGFGQENFTFHVIVVEEDLPTGHQLVPPTLTEVSPSSPIVVEPGEEVNLKCYAQGYPDPQIHWIKEGISLAHRGTSLAVQSSSRGVSEHYSCTAKNVVGVATANFTLIVVGAVQPIQSHNAPPSPPPPLSPRGAPPPPRGAPQPPEDLVVLGAFNTTVKLGGNTTLQCTVTADLTPKISWLKEIPPSPSHKNNRTMNLENRLFLIIKSTVSPAIQPSSDATKTYLFNLEIENAQLEDQGLYGCLGANALGYSYREAYLRVISERPPPVWDEELVTESQPTKLTFTFIMSAGVSVIVLTVIVVVCKVHCKSRSKSATTTTTKLASPSPLMNKYDDPASFVPLNPEKKSLPGLQQAITNKINPKHDTMSSDSTLPLPPPVLHTEASFQHESLVYPPGRSRPLPHGPRFTDHYVYPSENSYMDPGYCDPYMEKIGHECESQSSLDVYSDALHIPHPNTPNPLLPPQNHHSYHSDVGPHSSPSTIHTPLPNTPQLTRYPAGHPRVANKSNDSGFNETRSNSKRSDSRTTTVTSNANSLLREGGGRVPSEQYYNSVSSSYGGEGVGNYSSPVQHAYNSFPVNNYHRNNPNSSFNNITQSSEHSYAQLTPRSSSPATQFGRSFPMTSDGQSQFVVHCNL